MVKHKEINSDSEEASAAREPRFRVRVCMSRVFRDERARAYVCVSPRRRVAWLQRRLRRLFALPPHRLLSRGHLLPPDEPLALLDPDDPVEVIPVDAEVDNEPAEDGLDAIETVPISTEELVRSPSPVCVDVLTETKRQALIMLEQYSATTAQDAAQRPRRRRVRRRRRVEPAAPSAADGPFGVVPPAADGPLGAVPPAADGPLGAAPPAADGPLGAVPPAADGPLGAVPPAADGPLGAVPPAADGPLGAVPPAADVPLGAPPVLRNRLQPRAPRVVRPLAATATPPFSRPVPSPPFANFT